MRNILEDNSLTLHCLTAVISMRKNVASEIYFYLRAEAFYGIIRDVNFQNTRRHKMKFSTIMIVFALAFAFA
jgi:hypothetical protein